MVLQPIHPLHDRITAGQRSLEWYHLLPQRAALLVDTSFQGTMPGRQQQQFLVHSGFLA